MKTLTLLLLNAIIQVESGGNIRAVGDDGRAFGMLQIHAVVVQDVNRVYGTTFTHDDMFEPAKATEVFFMYLNYWVTPERLGRAPTSEDYARVWNGGPLGWKKEATVKYWLKVKAQLEKQR